MERVVYGFYGVFKEWIRMLIFNVYRVIRVKTYVNIFFLLISSSR